MPRSQRDDYHLLSGEQQVVLVRLRTGHNRLNSHIHGKLKLTSSPTCPCGQEDQTTEHVLQRCLLHKATREDVWPVSTSRTTKLYGCKQELEKTDVIHLLSGLDRVVCERQEEEEGWYGSTGESSARPRDLLLSRRAPYHPVIERVALEAKRVKVL